ncbi:hypothetical protein N0V82_008014 [Gnomoniopsis sp. IMI 355080]|nr:hypothetical protein N0V82_008014 [Gnomoniopsis sp. IMI 355080]
MARFGRTGPRLQPAPGSHPRQPLRGVSGVAWEDLFRVEIDNVSVVQLDEDSVVLVPSDYEEDPGPVDNQEEPNGREHLSQRTQLTSDALRVWKTTAVYEHITEPHARLVPFKGRDPWTGFPILAKPSGPPLSVFLAEHRSVMYSQPTGASADEGVGRILPQYRPLIYQWALHLISGLVFIGSHSVVFGDLRTDACWLSQPGLALSLVGFLDAGFRSPAISSGTQYNGSSWRDEPFHPLHVPRFQAVVPTVRTDLFLWGCLVYELMTGLWPGSGSSTPHAQTQQMLVTRQWPALKEGFWAVLSKGAGRICMGPVGVMADLVSTLEADGFEIDGDDIRGGQFDQLFATVQGE